MRDFRLTSKDRERIGERVRAARLLCDLSQMQLAGKLGLRTKTSIVHWEHGVIPEPPMRARIAAALDQPAEVLWAEEVARLDSMRATLR
jgi:transcriptional regulator with XRE-family HTH domain